MRGEDGGHGQRTVDQRQRVGVDHHGYAVEQRLGEHRRDVGAAARADGPGLHLAVLDDHVRVGRDHLVASAGDVADHATQPGRRPRYAEHAGAGVGHRARSHADHAPRVLVRVRLGERQQRRHVIGLEALDGRVGEVEPDVEPAGCGQRDEVHHAGVGGRGVGEQRHLVGPEGDRHLGPHRRCADLARVDVDPGRDVDGDDRYPCECLDRGLGLGLEAWAAADADDAVDHQVLLLSRRLGDAATACPGQRGQSALVRVVRQQPGADPAPSPGQQRAGVQRVTAVVAAADQQHHPRAVAVPQQVEHRARQPRGRPLHQRPLRQPCHQRLLRRPHLVDRVRAPHAVTLAVQVSPADRGNLHLRPQRTAKSLEHASARVTSDGNAHTAYLG